MRQQILLIVPHLEKSKGGIRNYFKSIKPHFDLDVEYFTRGSRTWPNRKNFLYEQTRAFFDLIKLGFKLINRRIVLVQTSTSLGSYSVFRDGLFILLAWIFRKKGIVFFRGWDEKFERQIEKNYFKLFRFVFSKADAFIVLSEKFKKKLQQWGFTQKIYVETTVVDETLLKDYSLEKCIDKYDEEYYTILFLARVEKNKGIYEAIDAYSIVVKEMPNIRMIIAGDGFELEKCRQYVKDKKLTNITFPGFVESNEKAAVFSKSHVYVFPSYSEGMPNSVLEAMAFGLPIVTRNVGGVSDIFEDGENGFITDSLDPEVLSELLLKLLKDKRLMKKIAAQNYNQAQEHYLTSKVVQRLEKIYQDVIGS